ncbi:uncharacterized protein [Leptinotarsa decemlineata]|uniref:uncharacterized protein n=1 Tax=Leptinotarsa decemlineata TaxID=7539 RepID=UPI003D3073C1
MDDDPEEELILKKFATYRKQVTAVFQNRKIEGIFNSLIKSHLHDEDEKFQNYVRFARKRFQFVLSLVEEDLTTPSYNRIEEPITAVEKLTLGKVAKVSDHSGIIQITVIWLPDFTLCNKHDRS